MKDKILKYLAAGLKPAQVATLVGCAPGYISQLLAEDDFKARLAAAIADSPATEYDNMGTRYQGLEADLINAMRDAMPQSELPAITRALEVVAGIQDKRYQRANPVAQQAAINVNVVQLSLPAHAIPKAQSIQLSEQSEIVAIDGVPLAPLSSGGVRDLFSRIQASKQGLGPAIEE